MGITNVLHSWTMLELFLQAENNMDSLSWVYISVLLYIPFAHIIRRSFLRAKAKLSGFFPPLRSQRLSLATPSLT